MKRARRIAITLTAIVAVLLALPLMVYVPPVQRWLVDKATAIASDATGMDISIGAVSLRFPLTLSLDDVLVTRPAGADSCACPPSLPRDCQRCDTIADIRRVDASVALLPLFSLRVELGGLTISEARLNTLDLISDTQVSGTVGCLDVGSANALLDSGTVDLSSLLLADADLLVQLSDTAAVDTTESEALPWRIALREATLSNVSCRVHTPGDSIIVATTLAKAVAAGCDVNLAEERYTVATLSIDRSALSFDRPYEPRLSQAQPPTLIDYSHLSLSDLSLSIDSVVYRTLPPAPVGSATSASPFLTLAVRHAAMKEQCGLQLSGLAASVALDSLGIRVPSITLTTPSSSLYAQASIDYSSFDAQQIANRTRYALGSSKKSVNSKLTLDASLSRHDLAHFYPLKSFPEWPLTIQAKGSGNVAAVDIETLNIGIPTVLHAEAKGSISLPASRFPSSTSHLKLSLEAYSLKPLLSALDIPQKGWSLPKGMRLNGLVDSDGKQYAADILARDGDATVKVKGLFDAQTVAYTADVDITSLDVSRYVPDVPANVDHVTINTRGHGFDPYDKKTFMDATASVGSLAYEQFRADSLTLNLSHEDAHSKAEIGFNSLATQLLSASKGTVDIGMTGTATVQTNLGDSHKLSALFTDIVIADSTGIYHPENLGLLLVARTDTTYARIQNGNFIVKADAGGPYDKLLSKLTALADTIDHQVENRIIDQGLIKQMLPQLRLYVTCGRDNAPANFLRASRDIDFQSFIADVNMSAEEGINGHIDMDKLGIGSTLIDTIRVTLIEGRHGLTFRTRVANRKKNPLVFTALMDGHLYENGLRVGLRIFDKAGRQGLRIGTQASMEADGMRFTLLPKNPTLAFQEFTLNDDNYLFLRNDLRLSAKVQMEDDSGTAIDVYSLDEDSLRLQDLTISVAKLNLKQLTDIAPFMPAIEGLFGGDFHVIMDDKKQISVASEAEVDDMVYEGNSLGDINTEFVYLQNTDNTHSVDGILLHEGRQVASVSGKYINKKVSDGHEYLDGQLELVNTPLNMANGFIADRIVGLEGYANGLFTMKGPLSALVVDGSVHLDSALLFSTPYGIRMAIDDQPVTVARSKLSLNNFRLYASDRLPATRVNSNASADTVAYLMVNGSADFGASGPAPVNFRISAKELQLINAKQQAGSLLFGKGFVSLMATLRGTTEKMTVRGRLNVLGKTDITYLLLDSPLSTDNQMDELVRFTDFSDSTEVAVVQRPVPGGMDLNLTVNIDEGAHIRCGLNADQSNYVDLFGGGNLRMKMSETEDMTLTGRYTISNGTMKYSLPVIPLKTFTIQDGSYVEFTGDMTNPTLNITATERTRATVGQDGSTSRSVAFDCGVIVTKTLKDMGLQFTISSPEDMSVQSELQSMTVEQRGKLAVTMLTTGMYLADGNTAGFSMNSALSSFLQSEINNIAGNALSTLDISMGVDNTTDASGNMHTDYSFQFAKRFWNNRLKVEIGGKVSSGQEVQGQKQSFFDNVSMEYRLSPTSNQYVKLFYKQNVYDWLEGYTSEYGAGYIYKRKLDHWWDMFQLWRMKDDSRYSK